VTNHYQTAGVGADVIDPNAKLSYVREFVVGVEREVMANTTVGVRYINKRIPRVLEDVANCPMVAYEFSSATSAVCGSVEYILTNPTSATPINPALLAIAPQFNSVKFDDPVHKYDAVEFTVNRRNVEQLVGAGVVPVLAPARELRGASIGTTTVNRIRASRRSTTSRPTIRPTCRSTAAARPPATFASSAPRTGFCRSIARIKGKLFGNYAFPFGLNLGLGFNVSSGKPLTPLAPNPSYSNGGEIPVAARDRASRPSTASRPERRSRVRWTSRRPTTSSSEGLARCR
jgi:hypothetical protein